MRHLPKVTIHLLVLSLAVPALATASPAGSDEPTAVTRTTAASVTAPTTAPASIVSPAALRAAIAQASGEVARQGVAAPVHARTTPRLVRHQGGGKTAMITTLVATVGGLIGTIYMIDYMKKQGENTSGS